MKSNPILPTTHDLARKTTPHPSQTLTTNYHTTPPPTPLATRPDAVTSPGGTTLTPNPITGIRTALEGRPLGEGKNCTIATRMMSS